MKTIWSIVSFLAVTHLLALLMFVGWLWQSERLSSDRITQMRELFAPTIAQAEQAQADAAAEAEANAQAARAQQRHDSPPVSSATRINHMSQLEEIEKRTRRRMEQEKAALLGELQARLDRLDEREAELEAQREQWRESVEAEQARLADEQFAKTVKQYESIKPRQGKQLLMELIADGEMDQAVAYLDAMNTRASSRILGEFKLEDEIELAAELLERLRTFGQTEEPQDDSNGENIADAR